MMSSILTSINSNEDDKMEQKFNYKLKAVSESSPEQ